MNNKVIGMDLGDKRNVIVVFDEAGNEHPPQSIANTASALQRFYARHSGADVVIEAGTHSAWISRLLRKMGHEVCVGNPRRLRAIWDSDDKSDERDARILGLMYRMEPRLLHPVTHRSEQAQATLAILKGRDQLVVSRTKLVNHVRGTLKTLGVALKGCTPLNMPRKAPEQIPTPLWPSVSAVLQTIEHLNEQIRDLDKDIHRICAEDYPETAYLLQVPGVGPKTALTYVLTLEDPKRFEKSRDVGAFVGLTPRRDQSGSIDRQLRITKAGNPMLRRLLVTAAQHVLGPFGPDCTLRRYGERIAERGAKRGKKCAIVAVARKLAVLLHRLWADQSEYRPFPDTKRTA
jgi:transposase